MDVKKENLTSLKEIERKVWQEAKRLQDEAEAKYQREVQIVTRISTDIVSESVKTSKQKIVAISAQAANKVCSTLTKRNTDTSDVQEAKKKTLEEAEKTLLDAKARLKAEYDTERARIEIWLSTQLEPLKSASAALEKELADEKSLGITSLKK